MGVLIRNWKPKLINNQMDHLSLEQKKQKLNHNRTEKQMSTRTFKIKLYNYEY